MDRGRPRRYCLLRFPSCRKPCLSRYVCPHLLDVWPTANNPHPSSMLSFVSCTMPSHLCSPLSICDYFPTICSLLLFPCFLPFFHRYFARFTCFKLSLDFAKKISAFSSSVSALCRPGLVFLFIPWGAPAESLEVTQRISIGSDTALQVRIQVTKYPAAFSSRRHPHQAVPPTTNASSLQHNLSPAPLA